MKLSVDESFFCLGVMLINKSAASPADGVLSISSWILVMSLLHHKNGLSTACKPSVSAVDCLPFLISPPPPPPLPLCPLHHSENLRHLQRFPPAAVSQESNSSCGCR